MDEKRQNRAAFKALASQAGMCTASAMVGGADAEIAGSAVQALPDGQSERLGLKHQLVECVCAGQSVGGQLMLEALLRRNRAEGRFAVLVDGCDALDPGTLPEPLLETLLWVRCGGMPRLIQSLDILLRDENFTMVIGDLRSHQKETFGRVPTTQWYRLQRIAHRRSSGCLILTDQASIPAAHTRWELSAAHNAEDWHLPRELLWQKVRRRMAEEGIGVVRPAAALG